MLFAKNINLIFASQISRPATNFRAQTGSFRTNPNSNGCQNDAVKIPVSSNGGQHLSGVTACLTGPPANNGVNQLTLNTIDRYCGGTLSCRVADLNPHTIIR